MKISKTVAICFLMFSFANAAMAEVRVKTGGFRRNDADGRYLSIEGTSVITYSNPLISKNAEVFVDYYFSGSGVENGEWCSGYRWGPYHVKMTKDESGVWTSPPLQSTYHVLGAQWRVALLMFRIFVKNPDQDPAEDPCDKRWGRKDFHYVRLPRFHTFPEEGGEVVLSPPAEAGCWNGKATSLPACSNN
jgi:hypothetical protein